jgi:hypothetical protein
MTIVVKDYTKTSQMTRHCGEHVCRLHLTAVVSLAVYELFEP